MKKIILIFLISLLISCVSTGAQWENSELFKTEDGGQIVKQYHEKLDGSFYTYKTLLAYDQKSSLGNSHSTEVYFTKFIFENQNMNSFYTVSMHYIADDWLFIDNFALSVDSKVFKFQDDNPLRDTTALGISEIVSSKALMNESDFIEQLKTCNSIKFQHVGTKIIEVKQKDINAVKEIINL